MGKGPYKVKVHVDTSSEECIGYKNNHLTIVSPVRKINGYRKLLCRCDCGNPYYVTPFDWKSGRTKSCGCSTSELLSKASLKLNHTEDLDRLRRIYNGMKCRCYNPHISNYKDYGGRGIIICDEWLNDREAFIDWSLSHGYRDDLSIDRIDVNGNYEPGNCRWATPAMQRENQRPRSPIGKRKVIFTINGETRSMIEWCEEYGVSTQFIHYRIKKKGMSPLEALTTPKLTGGRPYKK